MSSLSYALDSTQDALDLAACLDTIHLPGVVERLWEDHPAQGIRAAAGQVLFMQLDPSDALYLLLEGDVRLYAGDRPHQYVTGLVRGPALIGHRDLVLGCPAQESAACVTSCRLLAVPEDEVRAEWQANPELRATLWRDVAQCYVNATLVAGLNTQALDERVLRLCWDMESRTMPRYKIVADLVMATPKSVARAVADLKARDWLRLGEGGAFEVSPAALDALDLEGMPALFHSFALEKADGFC